MRRLLVLLCLAGSTAYAQDRSEIWLGAGIKREVVKDVIFGVQTNMRIRTDGKLETLFQEVSVKSEHLKWFRPSVDYRFITSYADNGNPTYSNRFNVNTDFRKKIKEVKVGFRARYQLVIGSGTGSGSDLDPALRLKPYVEYEIPKTRFSPGFSVEFFYNPVFGEFGQRFNRVRFGLGTDIDLPGPNTLSFTYYYGRKYNTGNPYAEHLISLEYGFEWKKKKAAVTE
ncbi:MAG TPA: DUF2490 domain-containing protein [Fluviicola sp.]|nr:DUF2490 domain-containing protein [Fluviicola sp.]